MTTVAFIGLGHMGSGMAANLARAGHDVRAFDLSADALERSRGAGCLPSGTVESAVEDAQAVVTMLPAGRHVREVYEGAVFGAARPGTLLIDCSTIDVVTARAMGDAAVARGLVAVDAPVSGGIGAAAAGTLTFMVGGSERGFARAEPLLSDMGKAVIHAGEAGAGQAAKICNNMLLGATMIATAEAFVLAGELGLDPRVFYDISSKASGQNWSMTSYCPLPGVGPDSPADHGYAGGFGAPLMLKDLRLSQDAARSVGASTPMGERATELYDWFVSDGGAAFDFSAIIRMLQAPSDL